MIEFFNRNTTPRMQLRSKAVIMYEQFNNTTRSESFKENAALLTTREKYTGLLSEGAVKRMTKAIDLLISSTPTKQILNPVTKRRQPFKLSFITLTLPACNILSDKKESKLMLEKLLRFLRSTHNMKSYVWKAETQKNGQIHYHITSDVYLHYSELRNYWNKILFKSGLFGEYFNNRGDRNINSTDIHSVKNIRDLGAYLIKYFTKKEQNETAIKGKVWDCSQNLKDFKYFTTDATEGDFWELYDGCKNFGIAKIETDRCIIFKNNKSTIFKFIDPLIIAAYDQYMINVYHNYREPKKIEVSYNLVDSCTEISAQPNIMPMFDPFT